ncbi:MAG: hypothetical protein KBD55_01160 [Candidatus Pacebacteria bacterium]|jgi:hypothetical protein|nr:hypothetical protein [Candidatus Paceibacterota bacterium]
MNFEPDVPNLVKGPAVKFTSLVIERGKTELFDNLPDNSIALDGYVQGPEFDLERNRFSFDHHDRVNRQITRASCQQVMDAILLGYEPKDASIHINDIDGDTVLSVWLLRHPEMAKDPKVRMLVESVGGVDAHGPAYLALDPELAEKFFQGVMKPEGDARRSRTYAQADLAVLLEQCLKNLDDLVSGKLEYTKVENEKSFKVIKEGSGWIMAESEDFVFDLVYKAGHTRAVAIQRQPDGSIAYTVAKKSELVSNFPVGPMSKEGSILYELNKIEPGWGGGSTIGGAPRNPDGSRSRLSPEQVFEVIERIVGKK